jgi:thiol-disulfide isomerase/thioredoxin
VLVNFFASWCVPCRKEMPAFQAVSAQLGDRVAFIGVNHNDDRAGALQLLADTGVRYPTGYDPEGHVAASYGLFGMPSTLFVGADGTLLETHTGEISRDQLEQTISRLFGV